MTNGNGKNPEDNIQAHFTYLLYKLMTSAKITNDLSSGFDHDRGKRQQELSNNKKLNRNTTLDQIYPQKCLQLCGTSRKSYLRFRIQVNINNE